MWIFKGTAFQAQARRFQQPQHDDMPMHMQRSQGHRWLKHKRIHDMLGTTKAQDPNSELDVRARQLKRKKIGYCGRRK
jgi:hypothetical protein